jgi:hypothetical protein
MSKSDETENIQMLRSRLTELSLQLEIAQRHRALIDLQSEYPTLDTLSHEARARLDAVYKSMHRGISIEIEALGIEYPENISLDQFLRDWVEDNWQSRLAGTNFGGVSPPQTIVHDAMKAMYEANLIAYEAREELLEIERGGLGLFRPSTPKKLLRSLLSLPIVPKILWKKAGAIFKNTKAEKLDQPTEATNVLAGDSRARKFNAPKRANELRATKRQHRIQQFFSRLGFLFTGGAAIFMVVMLSVGLLQLYNASAQAFGISWRIDTQHQPESEPEQPDYSPTSIESQYLGHQVAEKPDPHTAMLTSLLALEIILVAPLPYLLLLGLTRYIHALAYQERADEFRKELLEFKAFEVALFIAIIAAAVVDRVLRGKLDWSFASSVTLIISVLCIYYFVIEYASKEASEEERIHKLARQNKRRHHIAALSPIENRLVGGSILSRSDNHE